MPPPNRRPKRHWKNWQGNEHGAWSPPRGWSDPNMRQRGRSLFFRFLFVFGMMTAFVLGGMAILAFLLNQYFGGQEGVTVVVWLVGCGIAFVFAMTGLGIGVRAFRGIATPLGEIMGAADAVADGDLTIRVKEERGGEFGRLAQSFNRMTNELQKAETQRRNLTADVAHELRTPLHIIRGNLEGVMDGVYKPTQGFIEGLLDETNQLSRLVEDLQTLAMAEADQLSMSNENIDPSEFLSDLRTSFSGQAEQAGIKIEIDLKNEGIQSIRGDSVRLTQVFNNLIANAIRHTPQGGRILLESVSDESGVVISVRDTGEGIGEEDLEHIFDRFWRGDKARTHKTGVGGGLGLAIAKQIVKNHGGNIGVESTPGEGSVFRVQLPSQSRDL